MGFKNSYDIVVIGAGASGLMAAVYAAKEGRRVAVLEKMDKPARKLLISGAGRCNITNALARDDFIKHFGKNGRFLKFVFSEFFNKELLNYFSDLGINFKLEKDGRYFPQNDSAEAIADALLTQAKKTGAAIFTRAEVRRLVKRHSGKFAVSVAGRGVVAASRVIIATGGKSYPATGSSGGGFRLAADLGHKLTVPRPALTPLEINRRFIKKLKGLSVRDVGISVFYLGKTVARRRGDLLFSDIGLTGPAVLSLSRVVTRLRGKKRELFVSVDFYPDVDHKKLDKRLLSVITKHPRQVIKNFLKEFVPGSLNLLFMERLEIGAYERLHQLRSCERRKLKCLLKDFRFLIKGTGSFDIAMVTAGGVCLDEINSRTMESKLTKGLFFAGEVMDIDADTGGFNLQAAFSTGWLAGRCAAGHPE